MDAAQDDPPTAVAGDEMQRELSAQRKALEREFDSKLRDLKAQHKRQADKLQQDQLDWEAHKREQAKELADRAEKLRRLESNEHKVEGLKVEERKDLDGVRRRNKDLEEATLKAHAVQAKLDARLAKARDAMVPARRLLAWFGLLTVLGPLTWLAFAWRTAGRPAVVVAFAALGLGLLLNAWRWRLGSQVGQTRD